MKSNDPFSLQELLGHEDLTTVQNYMHMNDALIQDQKDYHITIGQARRYVQEIHQKLFLEWVYHHALSGTPVQDIHAFLVA